jgi:hypothetical protein
MTFHHVLEEPLSVGCDGDVATNGVGAGQLLAQGGKPVGTPGCEHRDRPGACEGPRHLLAEAAARPGDDDDAILEVGAIWTVPHLKSVQVYQLRILI